MTTSPEDRARMEELARKVARLRACTDPLGAKGFRRTRERVDREARARRGLFVAALAGFVAFLGVVARGNGAGERTAPPTRPGVVAEIPLTDANGKPTGTILRIIESEPRVRTRAS